DVNHPLDGAQRERAERAPKAEDRRLGSKFGTDALDLHSSGLTKCALRPPQVARHAASSPQRAVRARSGACWSGPTTDCGSAVWQRRHKISVPASLPGGEHLLQHDVTLDRSGEHIAVRVSGEPAVPLQQV